jgi:hypothetical protein
VLRTVLLFSIFSILKQPFESACSLATAVNSRFNCFDAIVPFIVSVEAQKYGGDSVHPIGKTREMVTSGSSLSLAGSKQASIPAWLMLRGILLG